MMKRTPTQFVETLERALFWRKKELTSLKFTVSRARSQQQEMLLRAAVCLLYAHWEGFIKDAAQEYVRYVVSQGLRLQDVAVHFVALGLRSDIVTAGASRRSTLHTSLIEKVLTGQDEQFRARWENAIDTGSNLDARYLTEILSLVGVNPANYVSKGRLLDERLLKNRNSIAHGRGMRIGFDDYSELHDVIVTLLDRFRDDLEQSAISSNYLRSQSSVS